MVFIGNKLQKFLYTENQHVMSYCIYIYTHEKKKKKCTIYSTTTILQCIRTNKNVFLDSKTELKKRFIKYYIIQSIAYILPFLNFTAIVGIELNNPITLIK